MIFYFSGTGNSKYVADKLSDILYPKGCMPTLIKVEDAAKFSPDYIKYYNSIGFVFPVYSWGIPPIIAEFISKLNEKFLFAASDKYIWVILTCGNETALAPEMIAKVLSNRGLTLDLCMSVMMPNNYVLLPGFNVDDKEIESEKLDNSISRIREIADCIINKKRCVDVIRGSWPGFKSKIIYPLFKRWGIFPKKWRWTPECIQCGKCAQSCPVGNIKIKGGHPSWGNNCTSCLACYHICPVHAVEYGSITRNKGQYLNHRK